MKTDPARPPAATWLAQITWVLIAVNMEDKMKEVISVHLTFKVLGENGE